MFACRRSLAFSANLKTFSSKELSRQLEHMFDVDLTPKKDFIDETFVLLRGEDLGLSSGSLHRRLSPL